MGEEESDNDSNYEEEESVTGESDVENVINETDDDANDEEEEENKEVVDPDENETKPGRINVTETAFDLAFHPSKEIIAVGEITGEISIFSYSIEENKKLLDFQHNKSACRCLNFSLDGQRLYSGSQNNSIYCTDMNTGSIIHALSNAHEQSISAMRIISDNFVASGCEAGVVKLWDTRIFSMVAEFSERKDYISDIACDEQKKTLLTTCGDGVLSVYNLRKHTVVQESDQMDDELLCLDIVKSGKKVVCGSAAGVLNIYSWGEWGDISDRYPTKSDYIESLCAITPDVICTGADDGFIKAMFVQPYKNIKTVGRHGCMGIGSLKLSPDKSLLASCGGNEIVRFWDVSSLHEEVMEPEERKGVKRKHSQGASKAADFFADL